MYRGWKSAGCRGWPVPKRGFGYGSLLTSAQVKRRYAADDDGVIDNIVNKNTESYGNSIDSKLKI